MSIGKRYVLVILFLVVTVATVLSAVLLLRFAAVLDQVTTSTGEALSPLLREQLEVRGKDLARFLADNLANPLYRQDLDRIGQILATATDQPEVTHAQVFDRDGRILHDGRPGIPGYGRPHPGGKHLLRSEHSRIVPGQGAWLDVIMPIRIGEEILGGVEVRLTLVPMQSRIQRMHALVRETGWRGMADQLPLLLALVLGLVAAAVLFSGMVARGLSRPIGLLARQADALGRGDLATPILLPRQDELGRLADTLDGMRRNLESSYSELGRRNEELRLFQFALEHSREMIFLLDDASRITFVNRQGCQGLGWPRQEMEGREIRELLPHWRPLDAKAANGPVPDNTPIRGHCLRKDGAPFPVEGRADFFLYKGRGVALVMLRDVTEARKAREALVAREAAEASNRAKSDFLASMSHELRTPMNGVLGLLQLMRTDELPPRARRLGEMAFQSAEGLLALLDDILDFSKVEAGKLELAPENLELRPLLEQLALLLGQRALAKGIELSVRAEEPLPRRIWCDPVRLRQVLVNLLGNAIKFTEEGEVELTAAWTDAGLLFTVRDTGIGISADTLGRLFTPFTQADGSITRRFGGTGLGLAICRRLADLMGGTIRAESTPGHGSAFMFHLPLPGTVPPPPPPASPLAGKRILVLEESPVGRQLWQRLASRWDSRLHLAASLEETALLLHQSPYHLLVLSPRGSDSPGQVADKLKTLCAPLPPTLLVQPFLPPEEERDFATLSRPLLSFQVEEALAALTRGEVTPATSPAVPSPLPPRSLQGYVLVAEDNEVNQVVAQGMLGRLGLSCDIAHDGPSVIRMAAAKAYDLILMDIQMPGMDGYSATRAIREQERLREDGRRLPIIALTAHAMDKDRHAALEAGMDDHLTKPLRRDALAATLATWLARKGD